MAYNDTLIIYWFIYSPMTCVHDKPANTPSTAPLLLPCETKPVQRLSIIIVRNTTERGPTLSLYSEGGGGAAVVEI